VKRIRRISLLLALGLFLGGGRLAAQTEDSNRIFTQAGPGVIGLIVYGEAKQELGRGTGFALAEDLVVTAYHLVSNAFDVKAVTLKGKELKTEGLVAVDKASDIAVLKVKGKLVPNPMGNTGLLKEGDRLFAVGQNETGALSAAEGTLRRLVEIGPGPKMMELSLALPNAFCGAPILDLNGQIVGLVLILDRGLRVGLPADRFLNVSRTGTVTAFKTAPKENYFEGLEGALLTGRMALPLGEDMTARVSLETVIKLNPQTLDAHAMLADVYTRQRDYPAAEGAYRKVLEIDGSRASAAYGLGTVLARQQKYADAAAAYENAVSLNVAAKEVFLELGSVYEELKDYAKAAGAYERFVAAGPVNPASGYLRLGLCRLQLDQSEAAVAALVEARKLQPRDLKTNVTLADAYKKAGRFAEAEATFTDLATINPQDATTYYGRIITMYDEVGKNDLAIGAARKIVDLNPKSDLAIYNLGIMFLKLQRHGEAIAEFRRCLEVNPNYSSAWYNIGFSFANQKKWAESIPAFRKFVELNPNDQSGWLNIGIGYMMLKDFENALPAMQQAVSLNPDNANAQFNLAIVYINLRDYYSARDVHKKIQSLDPALAARLQKLLQ
jgi:tetratricopeptide (TPR) repeat protein